MSSCIDYAINAVMNRSDISDYVLKLAFENPNGNYADSWWMTANQTSVEQGILEKIIYGIVLPSCDVMGGVTDIIDLAGSRTEMLGGANLGVNVPDFITGSRKIITVNKVVPGSLSTAGGFSTSNAEPCGSGVQTDVLNGFLSTINPSTPTVYTNISMVGVNAFVIHGCPSYLINFVAEVIMSYDENLTSIHPRHYEAFYTLVELATKAYIYKKCRHPTNEAVMRAGIPLDSIKDEVSNYADAGESYSEYLKETWTRYMTHSDTVGKNKAIKSYTTKKF